MRVEGNISDGASFLLLLLLLLLIHTFMRALVFWFFIYYFILFLFCGKKRGAPNGSHFFIAFSLPRFFLVFPRGGLCTMLLHGEMKISTSVMLMLFGVLFVPYLEVVCFEGIMHMNLFEI